MTQTPHASAPGLANARPRVLNGLLVASLPKAIRLRPPGVPAAVTRDPLWVPDHAWRIS